MLRPGTKKFNCSKCGKTPFEVQMFRVSRVWMCDICVRKSPAAFGGNVDGPLDIRRQKQPEYHGPVEPQKSIPLSIGGVECPATMCPLIAKDGSPNANVYAGTCPQHDDIDHGGCFWWKIGCSTGLQHKMVDEAVSAAKGNTRTSRTYDCPKASVCSWQKSAVANGRKLCPPRTALAAGVDPRVVNW